MIYCLVDGERLIHGLKFIINKEENYINSIDGLREFMIYHHWKIIPVWSYSNAGRKLITDMVQMHKELTEMEYSLLHVKK